MSNLNSLTLIGRLGRDPETRTLPSGMTVTNASLAVSEKWKDKQGQPQERTTWFDLAFWDKLGGIASQYLRKGSLIYVEGPVSARAYAARESGEPRAALELRVNQLKMLSSKQDSGEQPQSEQVAPAPTRQPGGMSATPAATASLAGNADFNDEIPF
jgi:single-strand DNA-binding protein